jgi:tetratricopeptide (TPR) repeat protein
VADSRFDEGTPEMLDEAHETLEGLRRLFAGEAAPVEVERAAAHLASCRKCWPLATRAIADQKAAGGIAAQGPLKPLVDLYEFEQVRLEERLDAQGAWIEIRSLSTKARRDKARLTRSLHTLTFLEELLEEGTRAASPAESEEIFYLALLVAQQLPSPRFSIELKNDLCAECCAEIANARRRLAKWLAARDALKKGHEYVARGSKSGVVKAKVLYTEAIVEEELGNSEEAAALLRRAAALFETGAQPFLKSKALARLAYILVDIDPAESLRVIEQAKALIPEDKPRLFLFAEGIRVDGLIAIGAPREAALRFEALRGLHEQFREPFVQLRRRFTAARLLESLGRYQRAESIFQEVIAGDLEHGLIKDFFLDLTYLFGFHLRRGQKDEAIAVCRRAGQELSLLEDEDGSCKPARDQMRLVWRSLEEEVKKGTADLGATSVLRNYVKAHWRAPASNPPFVAQPA